MLILRYKTNLPTRTQVSTRIDLIIYQQSL